MTMCISKQGSLSKHISLTKHGDKVIMTDTSKMVWGVGGWYHYRVHWNKRFKYAHLPNIARWIHKDKGWSMLIGEGVSAGTSDIVLIVVLDLENQIFLRGHSVLKGGGFFEVVVSWKQILVSAPLGWGLTRSNLYYSCSSHFDPIYGQKVSKNG